jgi:hypothetical protein
LPPSSERAEEVGRLRELLGDLSADAELLDGEDLEE